MQLRGTKVEERLQKIASYCAETTTDGNLANRSSRCDELQCNEIGILSGGIGCEMGMHETWKVIDMK